MVNHWAALYVIQIAADPVPCSLCLDLGLAHQAYHLLIGSAAADNTVPAMLIKIPVQADCNFICPCTAVGTSRWVSVILPFIIYISPHHQQYSSVLSSLCFSPPPRLAQSAGACR